jgi:hypothetical protein
MVGSRYYMNKHLLVYSLRPGVDDNSSEHAREHLLHKTRVSSAKEMTR